MARIRSIKPDFFMDEDLAEVSPLARLLYIGLWTLADKEGRLEDRPKRIKASLFPYDCTDVEPLLAELAQHGFIVRYEAEGRVCIAIPSFLKDQRPHPKETSYGLPPPPEPGTSTASREISRQGVDASGRVPVVVGCGSGYGNGSTASQGLDASAPVPSPDVGEREPLKLAPTPGGKPPRKPSAAEKLYAAIQEHRRDACEKAGVPWVDDGWAPARKNEQLGPVAKGSPGDQSRFNSAWQEYLDDPGGAKRDPPWNLGWFLVKRAEYESRALRHASAGGAA